MSYNISDIVKDVEICMDEIAANDAELDTQTTSETQTSSSSGTGDDSATSEPEEQDDSERATIIKSKIRDALMFIYAHADAALLEPSQTITTATVKTVTGGIGAKVVELPEGFVRLVYAGCSDWTRMLGQEDIISWNDPEYAMLTDTYVGATTLRPAVAMTWSDKKRMLELYPSGSSVSVGIMTDCGDITASTTSIDCPQRCYRALIYYISGLTYVTYADQTRSSMMFEQANDIMGFTASAGAKLTNNEQ